MPGYYKRYPKFVYSLRIAFLDFLARHRATCSGLCKFLKATRLKKAYALSTYIERTSGLRRVLRPGDTAIQAGVSTDTPWSQAFDIATAIKQGKLVAIEPDPRNQEILKTRFKRFSADIRLVPKATGEKKKTIGLYLGKNKSWTRVPAPWKSYRKARFEKDVYKAQADTIDNILKEQKIPHKDVNFVNLTNNGAEFDTLKGMTRVLKESKDICVAVIAGARGNTDALIDGRPDEEVIMDFLKKFGFRTRFRGFHEKGKGFGYVIGVKGNKPFLM